MTVTDTSTTSSTDGSVTTAANTTQHLTDATNAITQVTAYANVIANIVLNSTTTPPPSWFQPLNDALTLAQTHVKVWVETLGPDISSKAPQTIIDYGNLFSAATQDIIATLQASGYRPNSDQRQEILGDLSTLVDFIGTQTSAIGDLKTQLKTFQDNLLADHTSLAAAINGAQGQLESDNDQIATINAKIASITADLAAASTKATMSDIGIGLSIFIALVAVVAVVASGGAALPLLVAGVAVAGVGAAIGTAVVYTQQQAADIAELQTYNNELSDETAQVVALTAIINTTTTIVAANEAASAALDSITTVWTDLLTKTTSVQTALQHAHDAADAATFGAFAVKIWTTDAQTSWNQLVTFCTNMQTALLNTTVTNAVLPKAA